MFINVVVCFSKNRKLLFTLQIIPDFLINHKYWLDTCVTDNFQLLVKRIEIVKLYFTSTLIIKYRFLQNPNSLKYCKNYEYLVSKMQQKF